MWFTSGRMRPQKKGSKAYFSIADPDHFYTDPKSSI